MQMNWQKIVEIWVSGGWTMIPLGVVCLMIYGIATYLMLHLRKRDYLRVPESTWARWIEKPDDGEGEIGEIIRYTQDEAPTIEEMQKRFSEISATKLPEIDRGIAFMNVLVTCAPLLGLLGTVFGMLVTFKAISVGGGKLAEMVARGISEALITTEMGLLIAIPGYFLTFVIRRKKTEYEGFLAKLESYTVQFYRKKLKLT